MMFGYGYGGPGGWLWMLGGLVVMVGIVLLVVWAFTGAPRTTRDDGRPTPLEILREPTPAARSRRRSSSTPGSSWSATDARAQDRPRGCRPGDRGGPSEGWRASLLRTASALPVVSLFARGPVAQRPGTLPSINRAQ